VIETKAVRLPAANQHVYFEFEFAVGMITDTLGHTWQRHDDYHWSTEIVIAGVTYITVIPVTVH